MKATVILLLMSLPGMGALAQQAREPVRFAIVLGQNISDRPDQPGLLYADDDAVATHRMFLQAGITSVLLVNLDADSKRLYPKLVPAGRPTREELFSAFSQLKSQMSKEAKKEREVEFLLVYSGHGNVEHGEGYIVLEEGRLTRSELRDEILKESPAARNHVIVDACKSYYLAFEKGPGGERHPYTKHFVEREDASVLANAGFLLSTSSGRDSHEWERFQAGVFSHEVRSALRGGADIDGNRRITYEEIGAFLDTANERIANPRYRPDFLVLPPGEYSRDLIDWTDHKNVLILDDASWGHVYLESARGDRLADIHPADGECFYIHIPPERPLFLRRADESGELAIAKVGTTRMTDLSPRAVRIRKKGALHLAFEELFGEPFGSGKVRAYRQYMTPGTPTQDLTLTARIQPTPFETAKNIVFWTAIGSVALGGAASVWAYSLYSEGESLSQIQRESTNRDIQKLNLAAVIFYSVAGAAAATWLTMVLWPEDFEGERGVVITPMVGPESVGFGLTLGIGD